jgi:PBP1b-binding outer membrane lipoprotein LpoB
MFIKSIYKAILTIFLILFVTGCGSSEEATINEEVKTVADEEIIVPDLKVDIKELYCWVDLMPGGPNRFQISGNLNVSESFKYELKFLKLKAVRIFQNEKQNIQYKT